VSSSRWRARAARLAGAVVFAALCGCDGSMSTPLTGACTEIGAQCERPEGPLGVCQAVACSASTPAPCFRCTAQH